MIWRMVRTMSRAVAEGSWSRAKQKTTVGISHCLSRWPANEQIFPSPFHRHGVVVSSIVSIPCAQSRAFHARRRGSPFVGDIRGWISSLRRFRKLRRRQGIKKRTAAVKREVELKVKVCIDEGLSPDAEILNVAEMLRLNVAMAMKIAFDGLQASGYKARDRSISDIRSYQRAELNVLLCNDDFIRKLSNEKREQDQITGLVSISRHSPALNLPILILGDLVISVETAARNAEERGYRLLDEIRILVVQGLLDLLGFNCGTNDEVKMESEKEVELILGSLGWKRNGTHQKFYACTN
ncbi:endoribonuclease YBEY, chloroplastic-like [Wolffia australiana]